MSPPKWIMGPWQVWRMAEWSNWPGLASTIGAGRTLIARLPVPRSDHTVERINAEAQLIAAAPSLYAALADLVRRCDGEEGVRADGTNIDTLGAHAALDQALPGAWLEVSDG